METRLPLSPPDFLVASLSSFFFTPRISTALVLPTPPPQTSCHLPQTKPSLTDSADGIFISQFVESFLLTLTLLHCFAEGPAFREPPTASRSAQPDHLAALSDLYFQLFGGFRALPWTTDRKRGARRLSALPHTLKGRGHDHIVGPDSFCAHVRPCVFESVTSDCKQHPVSPHPKKILLGM